MRLALLCALLAACGDDDGVAVFYDAPTDTSPDAIVRFDAPVGDPYGAWQSGPSLFACFGTNGGADFADTLAEAITSQCCYWDRSGLIYYTNGVTGTWTLESPDGRLVITQDPPCGDSCGPLYYEKLDGESCQF